MLENVLNSPDFVKYLKKFKTGEKLFFEGDSSQDLYVLVSGELDILKGDKRFAGISQRGAVFGEMSPILGLKRTATVKTRGPVEALRIPKEEIPSFLERFPDAVEEICRNLASRLSETSQIAYGLQVFCDQIPDAVIMTDRAGKILYWNVAAEELYDVDPASMEGGSVEELYEDTEGYRGLLQEVLSGSRPVERVLKTKAFKGRGERFVSTNMTALYDGHHNFQGVLSLGRDATRFQVLERKYRKARLWLVPSLALVVLMGVALFAGFPYFSRGLKTLDASQSGLKNQLAKDCLLLESLLAGPLAQGDRAGTGRILRHFLEVQEGSSLPYTGVLLLDAEKTVFEACSVKHSGEDERFLGQYYKGIPFEPNKDSRHYVLTLYRLDDAHPLGKEEIEVAFPIEKEGNLLGYLVFQMNEGLLTEHYRMDEEALKALVFKGLE